MIEQDAIFWYNKMKRTNIVRVLFKNPHMYMLHWLYYVWYVYNNFSFIIFVYLYMCTYFTIIIDQSSLI